MKSKRLDKSEKALKLIEKGKVKLIAETNNAYYFEATSLYDEKLIHDVLLKKFDNGKVPYNCTCKWFTYRFRECSHILACKLFLDMKSENNNIFL